MLLEAGIGIEGIKMAWDDVKSIVGIGQTIVIGIIVIAVTAAIGYFIVTTLNTTSNDTLSLAVTMVEGALGPIGGGLQFMALLFLVVIAVAVIQSLRKTTE